MKDQKGYPWYVQILFWLQKRKYGAVLKSATVWAKAPRVFLALSWLYGVLDRKRSPLSPSLRSLVIVRISQINGCSFCIDLNTAVLLARGVSIEKALALQRWRTSELFTDLEKATLEYAEAVTTSREKINPELWLTMREFFNETALVELTALIAFQNMSTTFNNAFGIEPQGFCSLSSIEITQKG
jgi:AhpD family alkylhydroperoxidase